MNENNNVSTQPTVTTPPKKKRRHHHRSRQNGVQSLTAGGDTVRTAGDGAAGTEPAGEQEATQVFPAPSSQASSPTPSASKKDEKKLEQDGKSSATAEQSSVKAVSQQSDQKQVTKPKTAASQVKNDTKKELTRPAQATKLGRMTAATVSGEKVDTSVKPDEDAIATNDDHDSQDTDRKPQLSHLPQASASVEQVKTKNGGSIRFGKVTTEDRATEKTPATAKEKTNVASQESTRNSTLSLQMIQRQRRRRKIIGGVILAALVVALMWWWQAGHSSTSPLVRPSDQQRPENGQKASLAGQVVLGGMTMTSTDRVGIFVREPGTQDWQDTGIRLVAGEKAWRYNQSIDGYRYEVQAAVLRGERVVAISQMLVATAPADSIELVFGSTIQDSQFGGQNATTVTNSSGSVVSPTSRQITGLVRVNGNVPVGSQVTVWVGENAADKSQIEQTAYVFPLDGSVLEYVISDVVADRAYVLDASLSDSNGRVLATADESLLSTGGAMDANFVINLPANLSPNVPVTPSPSTSKVDLHGEVSIDGPLRNGSNVLIMGRVQGRGDYQLWRRLTVMTGSKLPWSYPGVSEGTYYEIYAALEVGGQVVSTSEVRAVRAYSSSADLKLATNFDLAPIDDWSLAIVEPCQRTGDVWETYITIPAIDNARQYWLQVGKSVGSSHYYDQTVATDGQSVRVHVPNIPGGIKTQVRFSYAACGDCTGAHNFAKWSKVVTFTCQ